MCGEEFNRWIQGLSQGNNLAAQAIWERYYERLVRLAQRRIGYWRCHGWSASDVVQSAMKSFWKGFIAGRFPKLNDELDLWKLLVTITARKVLAKKRKDRRPTEGTIVDESGLHTTGGIDAILGVEPTPEFAVMAAEQCELLLECLPGDSWRQVALLKLEGHTRQEIGLQLGCSLTTVKRRLRDIRRRWHKWLMENEA